MAAQDFIGVTPSQRSAVVFALLLVLVSALLVSAFELPMHLGFDLAASQLFVAPFIFFLLWKIRLCGLRAPSAVMWSAIGCALLAVGYSYLHVNDASRVVIVARLNGDPFEISTRQFREQLARELVHSRMPRELQVQRSYASIGSHAEAESLLGVTEHVPAVIWGNARWVQVAMHPERTASLQPSEIEPWLRVLRLTPVTSVPAFGLSYEPQIATTRFLAAVNSGLLGGRASVGLGDEAQTSFAVQQFIDAAAQQASWSSFAHRAYAWWVLGNIELMQALRAGRYEPAVLKCAIDAYTRSRRSLKKGDNPELLAAALNNRAIAHSVMMVVERRPELKRLIRRELKIAAQAVRQRNLLGVPYRAPKIALLNLKYSGLRAKRNQSRGARKLNSRRRRANVLAK